MRRTPQQAAFIILTAVVLTACKTKHAITRATETQAVEYQALHDSTSTTITSETRQDERFTEEDTSALLVRFIPEGGRVKLDSSGNVLFEDVMAVTHRGRRKAQAHKQTAITEQTTSTTTRDGTKTLLQTESTKEKQITRESKKIGLWAVISVIIAIFVLVLFLRPIHRRLFL